MKISAKTRYAMAALIQMGQNNILEEPVTIMSLSEKLGLSKIYLEQVFSLLKHGGVVKSIKGARGGYQITRPMNEITVYDVFFAIEHSLFQPTDTTVEENAFNIENVLQKNIYAKLDATISNMLKQITLDILLNKAMQQSGVEMYYI